MEWYKAESTVRPQETDLSSSKKFNYVRKDITEVEREAEGETVTMYEYKEAAILKEDWGVYLDLVQAQADIEYLNMITEEL